jgi:hypothetical protein
LRSSISLAGDVSLGLSFRFEEFPNPTAIEFGPHHELQVRMLVRFDGELDLRHSNSCYFLRQTGVYGRVRT